MNYDRILSKTVDYEKIQYGILYANGKIRGYQDKYLRMARRVHERIGATVICASNSDLDGRVQLKIDKALINKVINERCPDNYELYFVGTSDGGEHSLKLSQQFPKTVKFLGLNSSWSSIEDFIERIKSLSHVKKTFVYGAMDVDFDDIAPRLKVLECDNLEFVVLDGVDHDFTGKVEDFIAMIDLI